MSAVGKCSNCEREHDGAYWWAEYCSRSCRHEAEGGPGDDLLVASSADTRPSTGLCAGCGEPLTARRARARWCGEACRARTKRLDHALGLDAEELGWSPGEYPERSARLWAGLRALGVPEPPRAPGQGEAPTEQAEGRQGARNPFRNWSRRSRRPAWRVGDRR